MGKGMKFTTKALASAVLLIGQAVGLAHAQLHAPTPVPSPEKKPIVATATGFEALAKGTRIVLLPPVVSYHIVPLGTDIELDQESIDQANKAITQVFPELFRSWGLEMVTVAGDQAQAGAQALQLAGPLLRSVSRFHGHPSAKPLSGKEGQLDWSFGNNWGSISQASGARYGLLVYTRNVRPSAGRTAAAIGLSILGGVAGAAIARAPGQPYLVQMHVPTVGREFYTALVDLQDGKLVWAPVGALGLADFTSESSLRRNVPNFYANFPLQGGMPRRPEASGSDISQQR